MKERLTNKQLSIFCFMQEFFKDNDQLPSAMLIAQHVGATTQESGWHHRRTLAKKGYIEKNAAGGYRFKRGAA
jgi:SOS-response transcriptional repressor LexA